MVVHGELAQIAHGIADAALAEEPALGEDVDEDFGLGGGVVRRHGQDGVDAAVTLAEGEGVDVLDGLGGLFLLVLFSVGVRMQDFRDSLPLLLRLVHLAGDGLGVVVDHARGLVGGAEAHLHSAANAFRAGDHVNVREQSKLDDFRIGNRS